MARPRLNRHQRYKEAPKNEALFEFDSESGGGLLSLTELNGQLIIDVFRCDNTVIVRAPEANLRGGISADVRESILEIVDEYWDKEERDYEEHEEGREIHVFRHLRKVRAALEKEGQADG